MSRSLRMTVTELEALVGQTDDGTRHELIDGELHVSTQPHVRHQRACSRICSDLDRWDAGTGVGIAVIAPGVIFAEDEAVAPDVVWVRRRPGVPVHDADGKLHSAPELVVEGLSPGPANERRDRETKLEVYSRRGVQEYWIVDWRLQSVEVYRRQGDGLRLTARLTAHDTVTSPLLPGFEARVADWCAWPETSAE